MVRNRRVYSSSSCSASKCEVQTSQAWPSDSAVAPGGGQCRQLRRNSASGALEKARRCSASRLVLYSTGAARALRTAAHSVISQALRLFSLRSGRSRDSRHTGHQARQRSGVANMPAPGEPGQHAVDHRLGPYRLAAGSTAENFRFLLRSACAVPAAGAASAYSRAQPHCRQLRSRSAAA